MNTSKSQNSSLSETSTTKKVKDTTGLTDRQISHWKEQKIISTPKNNKLSWKKYSGYDLYRLLILSKLREIGVGIDDIKRVNKNIGTGPGLEALHISAKYIAGGMRVYFHTDLKTYFEFLNELELIDQAKYGILPEDPLILIPLMPLLEKVLKRKIEPANLPLQLAKANNLKVEKKAKSDINEIEKKMLQAIREKKYQTLTVKVKEGKITFINREEGIYYQNK